MTNAKRIIIYLIALVIVTMTGCKSMIDSKVDEHGNTILLDTPKNRSLWALVMDGEIKNEVAGKRPPGGHKTWDERWLYSIRALEEGHQENYQKYIDYIIEKRQQEGLPPIKNYPSKKYNVINGAELD